MEIFGVGPVEFIIIAFVMLLLLGPAEMGRASKSIGRFLRRVVISPEWKAFKNATKELGGLPNKLIREAGLDELDMKPDIKQVEDDIQQSMNELVRPIADSKTKNAEPDKQ